MGSCPSAHAVQSVVAPAARGISFKGDGAKKAVDKEESGVFIESSQFASLSQAEEDENGQCGSNDESQPTFILRHGKTIARKNNVKRDATFASLQTDDAYSNLFRLERDGYIVQTSTQGTIQFGIPPESIKDCMMYGLEVPTYYVIYGEMFDRQCGLSVAEFEFPIYFNFFVKKRKVTILTTKALEQRIRTAFQETLFGPKAEDLKLQDDFIDIVSKDHYPNFKLEGEGLDPGRKTLTLEDLLEFQFIQEYKQTNLGENVTIRIAKESNDMGAFISVFRVFEFDELVAKVPVYLSLQLRQLDVDKPEAFVAPIFGLTVLGASHGFDPKGSTTGFVLWFNRVGIMVDPPPDSSRLLEEIGIKPSRIQGIILTHCHADHDAGTFQKILRQRQVNLYTTLTIKESFMRKYAAITGFSVQFLESLFNFKQVKIGEPVRLGCVSLNFFYSLHTIPCIGFHAKWGDKSFAYSADTNSSPTLIDSLFENGSIGKGRRDDLLNFPWNASVVLHEMGVPPIHTPESVLKEETERRSTLKDRLFIVHAAAKSSTELNQLRDMDTISLPVHRCKRCVQREVMAILRCQSYFGEICRSKSYLKKISLLADVSTLNQGEGIISAGQVFDSLYIILSGSADFIGEDGNTLETGGRLYATNSIGQEAILRFVDNGYMLDEKFRAEHTLVVHSQTMTLCKLNVSSLVEVLRQSPAIEKLWDSLRQADPGASRLEREVISCNHALSRILIEQDCILDFIKLLEKTPFSKLEPLEEPCMVIEGTVTVTQVDKNVGTFRGITMSNVDFNPKKGIGRGSLIGDMNKLVKGESGGELDIRGECDGVYFKIKRRGFYKLIKDYPGLMLQLLDQKILGGFRSSKA